MAPAARALFTGEQGFTLRAADELGVPPLRVEVHTAESLAADLFDGMAFTTDCRMNPKVRVHTGRNKKCSVFCEYRRNYFREAVTKTRSQASAVISIVRLMWRVEVNRR